MFFYNTIVANKNCSKEYTYSFSSKLSLNTVVQVEFGKKKFLGIVTSESCEVQNTKEILQVFDHIIDDKFLNFVYKFSEYNLCNIGAALEMVFPSISFKKGIPLLYNYNDKLFELHELLNLNIPKKDIKKLSAYKGSFIENHIKLDDDQKSNIKLIKSNKNVSVLEGVTGSGKTIVALEVVAALKSKVLILIPEINLAKNWFDVINFRFGKKAHIYHSQLSDFYRKSVYNWAISDEPGYIIGTRSALMLPFKNLDYIILDEEHSSSLRQERYPYYNSRDMAVLRSVYEEIPILLMSATPSLETVYNIEKKKYSHYKLNRAPKHGLAKVEYVKNSSKGLLSAEVIKQVEEAFKVNQQVLFFLNRKGYAPYCVCNNCKSVLNCISCDVPKTLYRNFQVICHKCYSTSYLPKVCPNCKTNTTWSFFGTGVEKLHSYLISIFKDYSFESITSDTLDISSQLERIHSNKINGIIATQVLAQGHDFKNIGLVIIVDADMGESSPDFRSMEKVYQLWQQIRGRSGRHDIKGKMIIQYFKESNKFIDFFKSVSIKEDLLLQRKKEGWPPFSRCVFIKYKGKDKSKIESQLDDFNINSEYVFGPLYYGMLKYVHEFRFLLKLPKKEKVGKYIKMFKKVKGAKMEVEVDPYTF